MDKSSTPRVQLYLVEWSCWPIVSRKALAKIGPKARPNLIDQGEDKIASTSREQAKKDWLAAHPKLQDSGWVTRARFRVDSVKLAKEE